MLKKKFFSLLLFLPLLLQAGGSLTDLHGLQLKNVKLPIYDKKLLQVMIFSDTARREDQVMIGGNTVLDSLLPEVDVDKVIDGWQVKLYPLDAPLKEVLKFWTKRRLTSSAVMFTPQCFINQQKKEAFGKAPVFMRAPMLDLNGIGFHTYFDKQVIEVAADVHITVRTSEYDPREILAGKIPMPQRYAPVFAESDSLRIDMKHNEIMLIGNVKVIDGDNVLTCDRLTVFLADKAEKKAAGTKGPRPDSGTMLKGVSRVLADGDVVLIRRAESGAADTPLQTAHCAHLEYEIPIGKIALTDEEGRPVITQNDGSRLTGKRIELLRLQQKVFVTGGCHIETVEKEGGAMRIIDSDKGDFDGAANTSLFTGNVKVTDSQMTMTCATMRVHFGGGQAKTKTDSAAGGYAEFSPASGKRQLERIHCEKDVLIVEKIDSALQKSGGKPPKTIFSQRAELNYVKDKLVFFDKVQVTDDKAFLHCDRLDFFLSERAAAQPASGASPIAGGAPGKSKKMTKVIATGNVYMKDRDDDLRTELMNLYFRDKPAGGKETPGMFQSGNSQLFKIECCGKVVATGKGAEPASQEGETAPVLPARRVLKAEYATSHLLKDYTEFHQNVSVVDGGNTVFCRDMYAFSGAAAEAAAKAINVKKDDPDADPFELDSSENSAPTRISLGEGVDLKRIVCRNEVVMNMRSGEKIQQSGGDTGVYSVSDGSIVITAVRPRRPWIRSEGRRQFSDVIRGNLISEELYGVGAIEVYPDVDTPQE